jgi:hypothetical protein
MLSRQFLAGFLISTGLWLLLLSFITIPEYTINIQHECLRPPGLTA